MLLIYDKTTGEVLDNTGTNSVIPWGPTGELAFVNTDARGVDRATVELIRLHDDHDHDLVQQLLHNRHHVDPATKDVVIDGPWPTRSLTAEPQSIPADGSATALVSYRNTFDDAPAQVTFDVNGVTETVALDDGTAELEVVATTPGLLTITCDDLVLTITAEEA